MRIDFALAGLNLLLPILIALCVPNIGYASFFAITIVIASLPWLLFYVVSSIRKRPIYRLLTTLNLSVSGFLLLMFYVLFQSHLDRMDMHFEQSKLHPLQTQVENRIKTYIQNNASYPQSYEPIQFGNLDSMKVSRLNDTSLTAEKVIQDIENDNLNLSELIQDNSEEAVYGNYFLRHSYLLKNRNGRKLSRVAFVELDRELNIRRIYNEEDFTKISWHDHFGKVQQEE